MFEYPLSKQDEFVTFNERLREIEPEVATAFRGLRQAADATARWTPSSVSSTS